ncbi:MAG TPA: carboxypeptidase-like regulatory domain-containing protein, partial [Gemmatimonadaceae bacterium]|nr:carboxypeptidase-like regulatory domain-containing protein [Gemmatimonadaceae bacterium]
AHIAECAQCAAAVAEARGFVAASTRILTALDSVPGGVLPAASTGPGSAQPAKRRRFVASRAWMAAAAVLVLSTVTVIAVRPGADTAQLRVAAATADKKELSTSAAPATSASATPAEEKPQDAVARNAPAPMQSREFAPADKPKSLDQNERLKSRLEAERQLTRARSSGGEPGATAGTVPRARAPEPQAPAPAVRLSEQPATPPTASALAKDLTDKRADVVSKSDSTSERRNSASAQGVSITGRVTSEAGAPLASASVILEGSGIGTITRDDGSYALTVPASRANGQTTSLVAKLIGYKADAAPIAPTSDSITHDFVLRSNPLQLGVVIVTGEGTTSANDKLGAAVSRDSAVVDSAPKQLSRNTIHSGDDTVVTTIYSVRGVSVSLVDHSRARDEAGRLQLRSAVSEMSEKSRKAAAAVNSISWSDSTGHTHTLRGPLTTEQLTQLKQTLFGANP